ncbi:uncharacterized protein LOC129594830 isoform X1 [Paramacrobiotus metropolitanus]|uniref:uncharacterized protein LOC129594830 isoform X1 n=1 Tax=Paramacrobiotus metropolitanus TaxID=2943436 RepID=UPI0024463FD8|nr:uncharacterized protein LOC129594830 isoform X1 [Paramacrobiotus metropolitanus]
MAAQRFYVLLAGVAVLLVGIKSDVKTVKPLNGNRIRTVEIPENEPMTFECSNANQPYMDLKSALFLETYVFDKKQQSCRLTPSFCQPSSNLLRLPDGIAPMFSDCFNQRTCTLSFDKTDRMSLGQCGLATPMRLVVTYNCSDVQVELPKPDETLKNALFDSPSCNMNSKLRRACG